MEKLEKEIVEAIMEKKGKDITIINLKKLNYLLCDKFVICHGDSTVHVSAIAEGIEKNIREKLNYKPHHLEGNSNSLWILLDYEDIIIHIFLKPMRDFYRLEELWGDAEIIKIENEY